MKKKMFLTVVAAVAIAVSAQAQTQRVTPGKPYTFTATAAEGGGTISYQWFRNGEPISGATDVSYTLPESLAYGISISFTRSAVSNACPHNISYTEPFVVTFCDLLVGATCWATTNVAAPNTFAPRPDMYTQFYQWNRLTAWAATGTNVSGWNATPDQSSTWTVNPCPAGWRLPTQTELQALHDAGTVWTEAASPRGNAVAGRFYGGRCGSCLLPDDTNDCIFLPAVGLRDGNTGVLSVLPSTGGLYWSSTQANATLGYNLAIYSTNSNPSSNGGKATGRSIRCVQ